MFLYEIDTNGYLVNDRCYGTMGNDPGGWFSILSNGMIMISLFTSEGVSADKTEPSRGGSDAWFLFLDSNLNIVYQKTLGGSQHELSIPLANESAIFEWPDGSVLVGALSRSGVSGDKTIPASTPSNPSNADIWLVRFRPGLLTGLEDVPTVITTPFVFPNPANDAITLQVEQAKSYRVIQLDGRELISGTNSPPNAFTIDCSAWSSGVYFVEVIQQNGTRWLNKVVKE